MRRNEYYLLTWTKFKSGSRPVWPDLAKNFHFGYILQTVAIMEGFWLNFQPTLVFFLLLDKRHQQNFSYRDALYIDVTRIVTVDADATQRRQHRDRLYVRAFHSATGRY